MGVGGVGRGAGVGLGVGVGVGLGLGVGLSHTNLVTKSPKPRCQKGVNSKILSWVAHL